MIHYNGGGRCLIYMFIYNKYPITSGRGNTCSAFKKYANFQVRDHLYLRKFEDFK
jgi:hypothetical protein